MADFLSNLLQPEDIDFAKYLRESEPQARTRPASAYRDDLFIEFGPRSHVSHKPHMFSTKLRDRIEFRNGEVTAWAGYNGHRKSMFAGQVALDLCVQRQRVLMVSLEMSPLQTIARMVKQASACSLPSREFIECFSAWSNDKLWLYDHIGALSPAMCEAVCRYFADKLKGKHVFIDSMAIVCQSEEHLDEQKKFIVNIVRIAQETGLHIHVVAHCRKPMNDNQPPTKYDLKGSGSISDLAHNVLMVWANKQKVDKLSVSPNDIEALEQPDALVWVTKQRNGTWEGKVKLWFHEPSLRFCDDRITMVEPYHLELT